MAEAKNAGYEVIMRDLEAGKFAPVYYLMGDESYYIDKISDYIADHALRPEERDFNQTVVFGSDVNASQIADVARRYPMMAERQVVIVKEAQNIKNTEALERYFAQQVCHRYSGNKTGENECNIVAAQHPDDFAGCGTCHLAYADFLAPVLGLEHGQTKQPNQCKGNADKGNRIDLTEIYQLVVIGFIQVVVKSDKLLIVHVAMFPDQTVGLG